ncbi:DeoR family transcriptional regulator, aga operon transcriptional repressor [Parapedobacter composti]|uniref:DeoR family transcriptional regulator, aga operon transcriptional repressor n=1 Tax=Parapedobacter composti TaxID=623281 RepID=A0A1I1JIV5_9SPHI|nr:DeoR/GlpR family DNA-binding transcription regulator [Parapedobacter composti]SFC48484.1 DeoR family transcriptional regulator, aga operon transcriptional repressor [Parapedobacter composti]
MNNVERHQFIMNQLQQNGAVNVLELCKLLEVSSVTIRKDLKLLEDRQLLFRTHGGATLNNPYTIDRTVFEKEKIQAAEKAAIAREAASLITDNDSVIIASGTTVQAMAQEIQPIGNLTVVTSALNVAVQLIKHPNVEILQLGGILRKSSTSVTGRYAESILNDFFCSKLFLGVDGIDLDFGLTTTNAQEAHLNRKMMEVSQRVIVLADSTKFGRRGFGRICGIEEVDQIITDNGVSPQTVKALERMGVKVTIAGEEQ